MSLLAIEDKQARLSLCTPNVKRKCIRGCICTGVCLYFYLPTGVSIYMYLNRSVFLYLYTGTFVFVFVQECKEKMQEWPLLYSAKQIPL